MRILASFVFVACVLSGCATKKDYRAEVKDTIAYLNGGQHPSSWAEGVALAGGAASFYRATEGAARTDLTDAERRWLPASKLFSFALKGAQAYAFIRLPDAVDVLVDDKVVESVVEELGDISDAGLSSESSSADQADLGGLIQLLSNPNSQKELGNARTIVATHYQSGNQKVPVVAFTAMPATEVEQLSTEELSSAFAAQVGDETFKLTSPPTIKPFDYGASQQILATLAAPTPPGPRSRAATQEKQPVTATNGWVFR